MENENNSGVVPILRLKLNTLWSKLSAVERIVFTKNATFVYSATSTYACFTLAVADLDQNRIVNAPMHYSK